MSLDNMVMNSEVKEPVISKVLTWVEALPRLLKGVRFTNVHWDKYEYIWYKPTHELKCNSTCCTDDIVPADVAKYIGRGTSVIVPSMYYIYRNGFLLTIGDDLFDDNSGEEQWYEI